jgi:oxygen-dependent protoporphyrinogen oxidase
MARIVVVGAGISGLATAFFLRQLGHRVQVLEGGDQAGGTIRTVVADGYLTEEGPNSTLDRGEALHDLIEAVGAGAECLEANPAAKRRFVVRNGRPIALPDGPAAFLTTPLFSAAAKLRLMLEPFVRRGRREESIAEFVSRRLGPEFLDWAIDPFVSGVYAGDPQRLSVRAATAKIYALEAQYGSLFIGAIRRMLRGRPGGPAPRGRLVSFRRGMQYLPEAIARALGDAVQTGARVDAIHPADGGSWLVQTGDARHTAERVVVSVPAPAAAALLGPLDAGLARMLAQIPYAPVASVALGFDRASIDHPLDGFGMLIPKRIGVETLGALFSSTLFPGRAPEGHALLTAFIGGARNPGIIEREEAALVARILEDLRPLLGIRGDPVFSRMKCWEKGIPQYDIGHLDRMGHIDDTLERWPGLHLRANWRDGISVGDCVANARALAEHIGAT